MLSSALLTALLAAAPASAPESLVRNAPVTAQLAAMFVSACLDGKLQMRPDQGREISRRELSSFDRDDAQGSKSARYFKIFKPAKAILVMADYDPPRYDGQTYLCMIETSILDLKAAARLISLALADLRPAQTLSETAYEAFVPQEGARIYVSRTQMALSRLDRAAADRRAARVSKAPPARKP
ncbi:MAG: hypothetical protein QOG72_1323 [Sphingomonadales bacterium]|jgi:hypothetical protein|nr:hypothetical protein [Sphingomonadales bacterium]